jgi:ketosteroid isomerase-like protein
VSPIATTGLPRWAGWADTWWAMSEGSVEVVRRHIEAFVGRDAPEALSWLDPFVVVDRTRVGALDEASVYGRDAVDHMISHYVGAFQDYDYTVEGLTDLGAGVVLAVITEGGSGKSSGVPVRHSFASLYTVIDRKIARITVFPSEKLAREAVGLAE